MPEKFPAQEWLFYVPKLNELIIVRIEFGLVMGGEREVEQLDGLSMSQLFRKSRPWFKLDQWNVE